MLGFGPKGFYDDLTSSVRFHRILRRGREYGSELSPEQALQPAPPNESPRGLHFICLNANISRQFEFLQNAWIMSTKFSGCNVEKATRFWAIVKQYRDARLLATLPFLATARCGGACPACHNL